MKNGLRNVYNIDSRLRVTWKILAKGFNATAASKSGMESDAKAKKIVISFYGYDLDKP